MSDRSRNDSHYLRILLAAVLFLGFCGAWSYLDALQKRNWFEALGHALLPNLAAALLAVVALYFFLERHGIAGAGPASSSLDEERIASLVVQSLASSREEPEATAVLRFYDKYRDVDWKSILASAASIDIYACYYDSWINQNFEGLVEFFRRGGKARVIVADPDHELAFKTTCGRFPEYSADLIRQKIGNTGTRLAEAHSQAGNSSATVESRYYPGLISFSMVIVDSGKLLLGIFEHDRKKKIDSPAVLLDLSRSASLREFFNKELSHILRTSRIANE